MYDVSHDNTVSKQELTTLLNHVPKELFSNSIRRASSQDAAYDSDTSNEHTSGGSNHDGVNHGDDYEEVDSYTNHDMVEKAFQECDLNHEGRLTFEEFKMWVQRNPEIMEYIESILPYSSNGPLQKKTHTNKKESLPHMKRISSKASMGSRQDLNHLAGDIFNHSTSSSRDRRISQMSIVAPPLERATSGSSLSGKGAALDGESCSAMAAVSSFRELHSSSSRSSFGDKEGSVMDSEEQARVFIIQAIEASQSEALKKSLNDLLETLPGGGIVQVSRYDSVDVYKTVVALEDYLWKTGKAFHMWSKRYYLVSGNCMYYYSHKSDVRPKGVIFLTGSIVERVKDEASALKGYFGFELLHQDLCTGEHHRHDKRVLYCRSEAQRDKWVSSLQHAAHVVPIEDDYVIGKELGRGRFSVVCECVNKVTGEHAAVKIIDKATIEPEEKGLLRTEIAVLKLVNHPNIIRMEGLYESKQYLYIVMEMLTGGELFERIVGRPRFTELEAAKLIRPLLESVAYLHDLGIVHRDLKPENILCGENLEDLKIADFGLSKMILPKEKMDAACGTLSYVAPEVLTMQGYGKEADLWSVGVIMFLLLCGKLPFDGDDHNEIIRSTIQADLKVNPAVWGKLSEESKTLMTSLLNKSPKERISARDALRHPFILNFNPHRRMTILNERNIAAKERERAASASMASALAIANNTGAGTSTRPAPIQITSAQTIPDSESSSPSDSIASSRASTPSPINSSKSPSPAPSTASLDRPVSTGPMTFGHGGIGQTAIMNRSTHGTNSDKSPRKIVGGKPDNVERVVSDDVSSVVSDLSFKHN
eukprot:CAMPEP_0119047024 /NCGR_PEP_ID=MMETSP1177-20130426/50489_1 /TAXON_ID=2985 /ORGANISM="Ochromonas sp, Strain CCMP1899" /LENGTH=819 /DNA_ID=CAMNT_0007020999 /DNA_START=459 /DNA_END=2918 /DNA_ORIENTATION=-